MALFPCDQFLGSALCKYIFDETKFQKRDALILSKQENLKKTLEKYPFDNIININEQFYGTISSENTKEKLIELYLTNYDQAIFPFNDFKSNGFLLGACFAKNIRAVNVSYSGNERVIIDCPGHDSIKTNLPKYKSQKWDRKIFNTIKQTLTKEFNKANTLIEDSQGERPTSGLVQGFPYDMEVFIRYLTAANWSRGCDIVEIGSGIGYGAYTLACHANKVLGVDNNNQAITFSKQVWENMCDNLEFKLGDASVLDLEEQSVDRVVCFEVLEHVSEPEDILHESYKILKKDGLLIASTPNPYLFPYRINDQKLYHDSPEEYRQQGIWAWHINGIMPNEAIKMVTEIGFSCAYLFYPTYIAGFDYLSKILNSSEVDLMITQLNTASKWSLNDFALAPEFSPWFSGYSYVLVAKK